METPTPVPVPIKPAKKATRNFSGLKKIFSFPISPRRQFLRLMVASAVLFIAVAAFHVYFFYRISSHDIFQADSATIAPSEPVVNATKLSAVLDRYAAKEGVRDAAPLMVPSVVEPSQ